MATQSEKHYIKTGGPDLQGLLVQSLPDWYPERAQLSYTCVNVQNRKFRWSEHFVFTFSNEREQDQIEILIKVLHDRDLMGRMQEEKISDQQRAKYEFQALESIHQALGKDRFEGISAIRPLAYYPDHNALALEYVPGKNFLALIQEAGKIGSDSLLVQRVSNVANISGRLLGAIHNIPKGLYPAESAFDVQEYQRVLKGKMETLSNLGIARKVVESLLLCCNSVLNDLVNKKNYIVTYGYLHGDYYPENIVQRADGNLYTIDTTLFQVGPIEQDIAKFLIGVELSKRCLLYGKVGMRDIVPTVVNQSFLNGYHEQNKYNLVVLGLMKILAALQRWIEILEIVRYGRFVVPGILFTQLRVEPVMLDYLANAINEIRKKG